MGARAALVAAKETGIRTGRPRAGGAGLIALLKLRKKDSISIRRFSVLAQRSRFVLT